MAIGWVENRYGAGFCGVMRGEVYFLWDMQSKRMIVLKTHMQMAYHYRTRFFIIIALQVAVRASTIILVEWPVESSRVECIIKGVTMKVKGP